MMEIGIWCNPIVNKLGVDEGFRVIAESGFDCVQLSVDFLLPVRWPFNQPQEVSVYENMSDAELIEVFMPYKAAAKKYGLRFGQLHAMHSYADVPETDYRIRAMLKRTVMLCAFLECKYLIVHPAFCEFDLRRMTQQEEWDANMALFGALIPNLKEHDVVVCLENLYTTHAGKYISAICQCPHEANRYVDTLNEMAGEKRFAFCLDVGHALMVGSQIDRVIHTLGHRLEALHLHDNDGIADLHAIPYTGLMDWSVVYTALKEIGYRNTLNFELYMIFEEELLPAALRYVASVGRFFSDKILHV